mmetsp:Transcript_20922/g.25899  ORF Transcript_20922/g.25899 Transcript_20922/m.25899 type:complete len:131 (-) Transcript_20922:217-609(-)
MSSFIRATRFPEVETATDTVTSNSTSTVTAATTSAAAPFENEKCRARQMNIIKTKTAIKTQQKERWIRASLRMTNNPVVSAMVHSNNMSDCQQVRELYRLCVANAKEDYDGGDQRLCDAAILYHGMCNGH